MATYEKKGLSQGGTGNAPILLTNMIPGSILIHTTPTSATVLDEVWLWAYNADSSNTATIILDVDYTQFLQFNIPPKGSMMLLGGIPFGGDGSSAKTINGEVNVSDVYVYGYVNRITP